MHDGVVCQHTDLETGLVSFADLAYLKGRDSCTADGGLLYAIDPSCVCCMESRFFYVTGNDVSVFLWHQQTTPLRQGSPGIREYNR